MRDLRRRISLVYAGSIHLRRKLPPENAHNAILTVFDIGRFVETMPSLLLHFRLEAPPKTCRRGCRDVKNCLKRPPCRNIQPYLQKRLSDFFRGWDAGTIVKARVGDEWLLVHRHPSLAQVAPPSGASSQAPAIQGKLEVTEVGVRLKL